MRLTATVFNAPLVSTTAVASALGFKMVVGFAQGNAGFRGDAGDGQAGKFRMGVDTGADGCAAKGKFAKIGLGRREGGRCRGAPGSHSRRIPGPAGLAWRPANECGQF